MITPTFIVLKLLNSLANPGPNTLFRTSSSLNTGSSGVKGVPISLMTENLSVNADPKSCLASAAAKFASV